MKNVKPTRMVSIVEFTNGEEVVRVPFPSMDGLKYDPLNYFRVNPSIGGGEFTDVPNVLLHRLPPGTPFMMYVTDDAKRMNRIISQGWTDSANGHRWKVFFAFPKDQHIKAFLVPQTSEVETIDDIGLHAYLTDTRSQSLKLGKYANRLLVPVHSHMHGENLEVSPDEQAAGINRVKLATGSEIIIRHTTFNGVDDRMKSLMDGVLLVSPRGAIELGMSNGLRTPKLGDIWHGHGVDSVEFWKGRIVLVPWLDVDVVVFGGKHILKADWFYWGCLGPEVEGVVHSDAQSVINFKQHDLLYEAGKNYMIDLYNSCKDSKSIRKFGLKHIRRIQKEELEENGVIHYDGFVLAEALRRRIDPLLFPGLLRKLVNFLTKKVMDFNRLRVPLEKTHKYAHVIPDVYMFDNMGDIHPERSRIPAGHIGFPDAEGGTQVVVNRQPNENTNAFFKLTVVDDKEHMYKKFRGRGICLLGPGLDADNPGAHEILSRLGGGDMDDTFVITVDPKWVNHYAHLPAYPEVDKLAELAAYQAEVSGRSGPGDGTLEEEYAEYLGMLDEFDTALEPELFNSMASSYGRKQFATAIRASQQSGVGIGPVVNMLITDFILSDPEYKAFMLNQLDLRAARAKEQKKYKLGKALRGRRDWLADRESYQGRKLATFLELVIDGAAKGENMALLGDVSEFLKEFHEGVQVYPTLCDWGKPRPDGSYGRIPRTKREAADYILVDSPICKSIKKLIVLRTRLFRKLTELGWRNVRPAEQVVLDQFPPSEETVIFVDGDPNHKSMRREMDAEERDMQMEDMEDIGIWSYWTKSWISFHNSGQAIDELPGTGDFERGEAFKRIEGELVQAEIDNGFEDDLMKELAVYIYGKTYTSEFESADEDAEGNVKQFRDGLLWMPRHANALMAAFDDLQLTALTRRVELDQFYRRFQEGTLKVEVKSGIVRRISDHSDLGLVSNCPDGKYIMQDAEICLRDVSPEISLAVDDMTPNEITDDEY